MLFILKKDMLCTLNDIGLKARPVSEFLFQLRLQKKCESDEKKGTRIFESKIHDKFAILKLG
jgi:hypothetical protein